MPTTAKVIAKKSSITTTTTITQKPTTNTKAPTTSKSQPTQNGNCLGKYQQCEGINYSVPIYCEPENTCMFFGEQYSMYTKYKLNMKIIIIIQNIYKAFFHFLFVLFFH
jgi:hypothetical protein